MVLPLDLNTGEMTTIVLPAIFIIKKTNRTENTKEISHSTTKETTMYKFEFVASLARLI